MKFKEQPEPRLSDEHARQYERFTGVPYDPEAIARAKAWAAFNRWHLALKTAAGERIKEEKMKGSAVIDGLKVTFLDYNIEEPISVTPALENLARAYIVAFKESAGGSEPRGYHPLPAFGVGFDFPPLRSLGVTQPR